MSFLLRIQTFLIVLGTLSSIVVPAGIVYAHGEQALSLREKGALLQCLNDPMTALACGTVDVEERLKEHSGGEVMRFYASALPPTECHLIGHIVGWQMYQRIPDLEEAMFECGYTCAGACVHGIAGAAFLDAIGVVASRTADVHVDAELVLEKGRRLCAESRTICHGIGHMLFQIHNEIRPALSVCEEIARGAAEQDCFRGIFMEHADAISTHDLIRGDTRAVALNPRDILYPCTLVDERHRHACFRYQPRLQDRLFESTGIPAGNKRTVLRTEACAALDASRDRASCIEGVARNFFELVVAGRAEPIAWCNSLPERRDRISCAFGIARPLVSYGHPAKAREYCGDIQGIPEKLACYYAMYSAQLFVAVQPEKGGNGALEGQMDDP